MKGVLEYMFSDKIINKLSGRNIETVPVTLEQIIELLNKVFIVPSSTDEDYNAIMKTVKGSIFLSRNLTSKDGRYELHRATATGGILLSLRRNTIWIHDTETDKFFEYKAYSFKKLKKSVNGLIASKKAGI